jgi:hypothetical protein
MRLVMAVVGAFLFAAAGFAFMNEASVPRVAFIWFGLAMAALTITIALPYPERRARS